MSKNSTKKREILVLDTSSLVAHPELIDAAVKCNIQIPIEVLEELDKLKTYKDHVGASARRVNRKLDALRERGSLTSGVKTENLSKIYVSTIADVSVLPSGVKDIVDNRIISVAYQLKKSKNTVYVVSEDIALRVKCDALGVLSKRADEIIQVKKGSFTGSQELEVSPSVIDTFYAEDKINPEDFGLENNYHPNEFVILKSGQSSALTKVWPDGIWRKLYYAPSTKGFKVQSIRPRNKEQRLALDLLLDPSMSMVTLTGMAGCGKTLLAIAAGIQELQSGNYDKIVISRPAESTSKEIGFLPGTKEEKMLPWLQPIMDNLKVVLGRQGEKYAQMMFEKGQIEIESLAYIRGRSFMKTYVIIDEAQNINAKEAKALITRIGARSKLVLLGDLEQIDSIRLNEYNSGLGLVVDKFREFDASGHITMIKGERSKLATYAAEKM